MPMHFSGDSPTGEQGCISIEVPVVCPHCRCKFREEVPIPPEATRPVTIPLKAEIDIGFNHAIPGDKVADIWLALHKQKEQWDATMAAFDSSGPFSEDEKSLYTILTRFIATDYSIGDIQVSDITHGGEVK